MNTNLGQSKGGSRKRSVSESETDRISTAVSSLKNKSQPNPILATELSNDHYRSNPNISPPDLVILRHLWGWEEVLGYNQD